MINGEFNRARDDLRNQWGLFGFLIILAAGFRLAAGLPGHMDVLLWDDMNYMFEGLEFPRINKTWGPLYGFWFKVLSIFATDPVRLYYLNAQVLVVAVPAVLYIVLWVLGVPVFLMLLFSFTFIVSPLNVETWPRISHFCLLLFLLFWLFSRLFRSRTSRWLVLATGALFLSYARSEFYLAFLLFLVAAAVDMVLEIRRNRWVPPIYGLLLGCVALWILFHWQLGVPLNNAGRSVKAFAQHFTFNYFLWNGITADWWLNWEEPFRKFFGEASTLGDCLKQNAGVFFHHVESNILGSFALLGRELGDLFLPGTVLRWDSAWKWIPAVILYGVLVKVYLQKGFLKLSRTLNMDVLAFLIFSVPAVISMVLIFPRDHYFYPLYAVLLILVLLPFDQPVIDTVLPVRIQRAFLLVLGLLLVLITPKGGAYDHFDLWREGQGRPNLKAIELLRTWDDKRSWTLLENDGGLIRFMEGEHTWFTTRDMDTSFLPFIQGRDVDLIYISGHLTRDPRLEADDTWNAFIKSPGKFNFDTIELEGEDEYLLVKSGSIN